MRTLPDAASTLFLLTVLAVSNDALADQWNEPNHVRFAWATTNQPASVSIPLPADVPPSDIERLIPVADARLLGYAVDGTAGEIVLHLLPTAEQVSFSAIDIDLRDGRARRFEFGTATVVWAGDAAGALTFERSLAATAGGLYQAVALRNSGEHPVLVTGVLFLPPELGEGRLLVGKGEAVPLLARLEEEMTPAARREASGKDSSSSHPAIAGFGWMPAGDLTLLLAPREAVVIAWTDRALPASGTATSFESQPIVEYRLAGPRAGSGESRRLGLPVVVRQP